MVGSMLLFLAWCFFLLGSSLTSADLVEHSFIVKNLTLEKLCQKRVVTAVNGSLPGPLLRVREGDTVVIHVHNESPYNVTIHWHGVFQKLTAWADGPEFITQCAIRPGNKYTYKFNIIGQEGTLWWHAHVSWLRATVYGGLIIHPRKGNSYPFPKPYREFPIILGEWWNANPLDVIKQALATGGAPNLSDAYTINGQPGDLFPCSKDQTTKFKVIQGKTYLLRIINAALNDQHFFSIADHNMTVVAIDATYTVPYPTDVVVLGPGQTVDVLMTANQPIGSYYMAARAYANAPGVAFDNTTATAILTYENATSPTPILPNLPAFNDTPTAHRFYSNLTGLTSARFWEPVITEVEEHMFMAIGLGLISCGKNAICQGPLNQSLAASINNISFQLPTKQSILQAHFFNLQGIYNSTFPSKPIMPFDYTNTNNSFNSNLVFTSKSTNVNHVKFNTTVEIIFQDTALVGIENHPMHIHGFNFHVMAQGFGNYDPEKDRQKFNLVNAQLRNTIAVPVGGWAAIRLRFNNPGAWILHCHLDVHLSWGLATVFVVHDGGTPSSTLPPPPEDLPKC